MKYYISALNGSLNWLLNIFPIYVHGEVNLTFMYKSHRSSSGHCLIRLRRCRVLDVLYKVVIIFWFSFLSKKIFRGLFTIYENSGHLVPWTKTIWINLYFLYHWMFLVKYKWNTASIFRCQLNMGIHSTLKVKVECHPFTLRLMCFHVLGEYSNSVKYDISDLWGSRKIKLSTFSPYTWIRNPILPWHTKVNG